MKFSFFFLCSFIALGSALGQTRLQEGRYSSADGLYSFEVSYIDKGLKVVEPSRTNIYTLGSDGLYHHSEAQYSNFYIRIISANELRTGSGRPTESVFTYVGPAMQPLTGDDAFSDECMAIAEKYHKLAQEDFETQAWTFCSLAATVKCAAEPEGFEAYARQVVLSLRTMVVDQNKCPCEDVISQELWNKYQLN